ncbi:MAG TPA: tetraacyldisaccharide 4'-kinase [Candidatus Polarisedimenticolaceae bacterium]|nr:tetraacyldisaccharide 4'-kinase [Candidatus Polarisedimenticolaceae bacterium]
MRAASLLAPLSAVYGLAIRARNAILDRKAPVNVDGIPVVSIGNLAVGGTGKTPLAAWVARRLVQERKLPAIVSRGYGGSAGPGPVVVSTGEGPRVDARVCGDEPYLLAKTLPGTIVVVGSDRVAGVRAAAAAGAHCVVLDDGFQHRRLHRDLDVVLLDGRDPFDGGLLPAGKLREPPGALARAGLVVLTRLGASDRAAEAEAAVRAAGFRGPIVRAGHRAVGFFGAAGEARPVPPRALAFCGIGDPGLFADDLAAAGVRVERLRAFRDHHAYSAARWLALRAEAEAIGIPLVTTEKDLSRLESVAGESLLDAPLLVLRVEAVVWNEGPLLAALRKAVP